MPLSGRVSLEGFVPSGFSSAVPMQEGEDMLAPGPAESGGDTWAAVLGGQRWLASPHRHRGASLLRRPAGHLRLQGATPAAPRPLVHLRGASSPARRRWKIKFALKNNAEHFNQVLARLWLTSSLNTP